MDLSKLPSSCSKLKRIDKTAIEKDRRDFWDEFYKKVHYNYFSIYSFVRYILYFVVSQASSTGRHGSTDCTVPGAASLADYKVKYISHK